MVVAILAVLAALAGSNLTPIIERWRVRQAVEEMTATYSFGRSEAIKRGGNITVRKRTVDTPPCAQPEDKADWSCGWILFDDINGNGVQEVGEPTLRSTPALVQINVKNGYASGDAFLFSRWGEVQGAALAFKVTPTRAGASAVTMLCVGAGGRVRAKPDATSCS